MDQDDGCGQENLGLRRVHPPCSWRREDPGDTSGAVRGVQKQPPGFHGETGRRNREGELGMRWAPSPYHVSPPPSDSGDLSTPRAGHSLVRCPGKTPVGTGAARGLCAPLELQEGGRVGPHGPEVRIPSSRRSRKELQELRPRGKSQKTIYSFLQMATGTIWLTNTDEQASGRDK